MASIFEKTGSSFIYAAYRDATGRRCQRTTRTSDRAKAQRLADEFEKAARLTEAERAAAAEKAASRTAPIHPLQLSLLAATLSPELARSSPATAISQATALLDAATCALEAAGEDEILRDAAQEWDMDFPPEELIPVKQAFDRQDHYKTLDSFLKALQARRLATDWHRPGQWMTTPANVEKMTLERHDKRKANDRERKKKAGAIGHQKESSSESRKPKSGSK